MEAGTSTGRLVSHILGALAEFERNLINERTREGFEAVKGRGQKMGRRYAMNQEQIRQARRLKENDIPSRSEEDRDACTVDIFDG